MAHSSVLSLVQLVTECPYINTIILTVYPMPQQVWSSTPYCHVGRPRKVTPSPEDDTPVLETMKGMPPLWFAGAENPLLCCCVLVLCPVPCIHTGLL